MTSVELGRQVGTEADVVAALGGHRLAMVVQDDTQWPLLEFSALEGFRHLSVATMKELLSHFEVPVTGPRPTTEKDVATCLFNWIFTELTADSSLPCSKAVLSGGRGASTVPSLLWIRS